jgi:hypothetical protein
MDRNLRSSQKASSNDFLPFGQCQPVDNFRTKIAPIDPVRRDPRALAEGSSPPRTTATNPSLNPGDLNLPRTSVAGVSNHHHSTGKVRLVD